MITSEASHDYKENFPKIYDRGFNFSIKLYIDCVSRLQIEGKIHQHNIYQLIGERAKTAFMLGCYDGFSNAEDCDIKVKI
jgi:hypothetical protein